MKALRDHFAGAGNATRNEAEADRLSESLHYKNERSMAFETFLTKCQHMFNIYDKEGEPMTEDAKIRFLFKKVQHSGLFAAIESLKAQQTLGNQLDYSQAASHLSTAVSQMPEYIAKSRNVSGVATGGSDGGNASIYDANGNIITGHIDGWSSLSREDRDKVIAERKRLGISTSSKNG